MRDDHVVGQKSGGEDVERAVDGMTSGTAGEAGRGAGVDGVVDGADQRGLLVPDRGEVDLAHAGRAEEQDGAAVRDRAQGLRHRLRCADRLHHVGEPAHQHQVRLAADDARAP